MKHFGFVNKVWSRVKDFGHSVNRGFNVVKTFVRKHAGTVAHVARTIGDVARNWSDLPYIGHAASAVGQVARGVTTGVDLAHRGLNAIERGQRNLRLPT